MIYLKTKTMERVNNRLGEEEDKISELEDRASKHTQTELYLEERKLKDRRRT